MTPSRFTALLRRLVAGVYRIEREEICCGDLTLRQYETLWALREAGPVTLGAASKLLSIDASTASRNLALLVEAKHLRRRRSPDDGRAVLFELTAKGKASLETLRCGEQEVLAAVLARVPAGERDAVERALALLVAAMDGDAAEGAPCCAPGTCNVRQELVG